MATWQRRTLVTIAAVLGLVALVAVVWVLRLPDPEGGPLDRVLADPDLDVVLGEDGDVRIGPAAAVADAPTVVFYPGAGVPPEAYAATWAPVVEATGAVVLIPAMPLALAVLDVDAAASVREDVGDRDGPWWIGGHSLGGAMAASFLTDQPTGDWDGLVLWAAYPPGDGIPDRDDLEVVSVSGTADGLTTPDDVEASRATLPPETTFAVLEGVNHAQFGAYGDQSGDGEATVTDDLARTAIARATADALTGDR